MNCGKICFASKAEAKVYVDGLMGKIRGKVFIYKCSRCPEWHLTKQTKKEQRRIKKIYR